MAQHAPNAALGRFLPVANPACRRSHNLTFSWMTGQYSAEMVLAHYLQGLEIVPFFWRACHVGRHRLRASSEGVSRVVLHVCN